MTDKVRAARAFAEARHAGQRRKDAAGSPYFIHLEEVARLTAEWGGDEVALCAAWLHDTVEDFPPTGLDDIAAAFGPVVSGIVGELTDDKTLPKAERKRLQVVRAPEKSPAACLVKLADKCSNCRSVAETPPQGWSAARRLAYIAWAQQVVNGLRHCPPAGLRRFRAIVEAAEERISV